MSRHRQPACGCTTRTDGTLRPCTTHQLEANLTYLDAAYTDLAAQLTATGRGTPGGTGGVSAPANLTALEVADGWYEDAAGDYMPGIKVSLLGDGRWYGLDPSTRHALGERRRPYERDGWGGLGADPRVHRSITWMLAQLPRLVGDGDLEAHCDMLREQTYRLCARARHALDGPGRRAGWDTCPVCVLRDARFPSGSRLTRPSTSTVIGGELVEQPAESVCLNPACAREDGSPRCWRWDPDFEEWTPVDAPVVDWKGRPLGVRDAGEMMRLIAESADPGRWAQVSA